MTDYYVFSTGDTTWLDPRRSIRLDVVNARTKRDADKVFRRDILPHRLHVAEWCIVSTSEPKFYERAERNGQP